MKSLLISFIFLNILTTGYGQVNIDTIYFPKENLEYLFFYNENEFQIVFNKSNNTNQYLIYKDSIIVDSSDCWDKYDFKEFQIDLTKGTVRFFSQTEFFDSMTIFKTKCRTLNLNDEKISFHIYPFHIFSFYKEGFIFGEIDKVKSDFYNPIIQKLKYLNLNTGDTIQLIDLGETLNKERSIQGVFYNHFCPNKIIVSTAVMNVYEGFPGFEKDYICNLKTNNIEEQSSFLNSLQFYAVNTNKIEALDGNYSFSDRKHILDSTGIKKNTLFSGWRFSGLNIHDNKILYYIFESHTDTYYKRRKKYERVFIPYRLSYFLETAFYKIMNDESIEQDVNNLNSLQLELLEKMIYAKHNQSFNEKYYQAFFNMYSFYNHFTKVETRLLDVSDLLTEMDKSNLKAIKKLKRIK